MHGDVYQPKGGACMSCEKLHADCSALDFKSMPVISATAGVKIVKCTERVPLKARKVVE